ncbi:MAG TPA: AraC family transcriptional regulator [Ramlibacter sp.]|nr:AraC family transcriptional regulator [Ramlibacter sp.]
MAEAASHSSAWVRGVVHLFASQGVDTDALLRDGGVDAERLKHVHERFTLAEFDRLWQLAVERAGNPTLGLDRTLARRYIDFNIAAQAMWSSPDLAAGLKVLSQYLELIHDGSMFTMATERGDRWIVLEHDSGVASPRQRVEFTMFGILLLCQTITHHQVRPLGVEFVFPEPEAFHPYRMAFHCPLRFGQQKNRMKLSQEDLALPVIGHGESLFAIQDHVIEARLARSGRGITGYRVAEEMIRHLHLGEPTREEMARKLGLTEVMFDRKLRSEGHAFEQLLDSVRRELAEHYLKQPGYTTVRVANLLGWETTTPLTAACKRWFGVNLSEFRHPSSAPGELNSSH